MTTVTRYVAFQAPGWLLAAALAAALWRWAGVAWPTCLLLALLWVLKDFLLYPVVRRAYEQDGQRTGVEQLIGMTAVARDRLDPRGDVVVRGERWAAEAEPGEAPIPPGATVRVSGARGMTLHVRRAEAGPPAPDASAAGA
jgi:membrane protein implicated in regulation of membrane protease activity